MAWYYEKGKDRPGLADEHANVGKWLCNTIDGSLQHNVKTLISPHPVFKGATCENLSLSPGCEEKNDLMLVQDEYCVAEISTVSRHADQLASERSVS